jgi:hypothetical protein
VPVRLVSICAVACLALGACGGSAPTPRQDRTAAVYTAILRAMLAPSADEAVVFVAPLPEQKSVSLETQAAVIRDFTDGVKVRFVDALSEAIDADTPGSPAKEGLVVLLGPVPAAGNPVEVDTERYESENAHTGIRFRVRATDDHWQAEAADEHAIPPSSSA